MLSQQHSQQSSNEPSDKPKRNPFCSRCRNHGKSAQVKGHKRHCEYRDCQCEGCRLVECRQIVSAAQIKRRRYQKQDEECGRRIEVSPPVLKREPASDPATLIAKTLMGSSAVGKSSLSHPATAMFMHQSPQQQNKQHAIPILPTVGAVIGATGPLGHNQTHSTSHNNHHLHLNHQIPPHPSNTHTVSSASSALSSSQLQVTAAASNGTVTLSPSCTNSHRLGLSNHLHHHPGSSSSSSSSDASLSNQLTSGGGGVNNTGLPPVPATSNALSDALHLFHLPNTVISSLAASNHQHQQQIASPSGHPMVAAAAAAAAAAANMHHLLPGSLNSSTSPHLAQVSHPSFREQISLVDEIHSSYGPLAVYAWLKAESFDLQKVRNTIELSRSSFDELLQLSGLSPMDSRSTHHRLMDLKSKYRAAAVAAAACYPHSLYHL